MTAREWIESAVCIFHGAGGLAKRPAILAAIALGIGFTGSAPAAERDKGFSAERASLAAQVVDGAELSRWLSGVHSHGEAMVARLEVALEDFELRTRRTPTAPRDAVRSVLAEEVAGVPLSSLFDKGGAQNSRPSQPGLEAEATIGMGSYRP